MPPDGVQYIGEDKAFSFLERYYPSEIRRCYNTINCNPLHTYHRTIQKVMLSPEDYDFLSYNCQTLVSEMSSGKRESPQLNHVFANLALGAAALGLVGLIVFAIDE
jgi:hypothetical protein